MVTTKSPYTSGTTFCLHDNFLQCLPLVSEALPAPHGTEARCVSGVTFSTSPLRPAGGFLSPLPVSQHRSPCIGWDAPDGRSFCNRLSGNSPAGLLFPPGCQLSSRLSLVLIHFFLNHSGNINGTSPDCLLPRCTALLPRPASSSLPARPDTVPNSSKAGTCPSQKAGGDCSGKPAPPPPPARQTVAAGKPARGSPLPGREADRQRPRTAAALPRRSGRAGHGASAAASSASGLEERRVPQQGGASEPSCLPPREGAQLSGRYSTS